MIGYDLDGVLISDLNWPEATCLREFLEIRRSEPRANFIPKGQYVIITGRNTTDYNYTVEWVERCLKDNLPMTLYHGCPDHRVGAAYKAKIINEQGITVFVESAWEQVEYIRKHCPNCKVYHFGSLVSETIFNL